MTREQIIELAKKFTHERYEECCEMIDDFKEKYNQEAYWIDCDNPYQAEMIQEYKDHGDLREDFPKDDSNLTPEQTTELELAVAKSYVDYALECEGTMVTVVCALLHDYFEEYLDKV